jgi:hypothetical protein
MKKVIFTLNINGYSPEITAITYPYIKKYAQKIGAEFVVIRDRKFPNFPITYEKLQIYELAKEMKADWIIYIDSDALVHPDLFDITEFINKDTVFQTGNDLANNRFTYDEYFRRDGRHIGSCNWFTVCSDLCLDLWKPLDISLNKALENMHPLQVELNAGQNVEHYIDDYVLSRNIAQYGLKYKNMGTLLKELGQGQIVRNYFSHRDLVKDIQKVEMIKEDINNWKI